MVFLRPVIPVFFLYWTLEVLFPAGLVAQEVYPENLAGKSWYASIVLQGRVLNDPVVAGDSDLVVYTDDRRIGRYGFAGEVRWIFSVPRGYRQTWKVQSDGTVWLYREDNSMVTALSLQDGSIAYTIDFPGTSGCGECSHIDGRLVDVRRASVRIFAGAGEDSSLLLEWEFPVEKYRKFYIDSGERIIIQSDTHTWFYTIDGRKIADIYAPGLPRDFYVVGESIILVNDNTGLAQSYDANGGLRHQFAAKQNSIPVVMAGTSGGRELMISLFEEGLWVEGLGVEGLSGEEGLVFRLEKDWEIINIARRGEMLYVSDSAWRIHRIDLTPMLEELYGVELTREPPAATVASDFSFLSDLLIYGSADRSQSLEQFNGIRKNIRTGNLRGRLLQYQRALAEFVGYMYGEEKPGLFLVSDPELRSAAISALLSVASGGQRRLAVNMLRREVHPDVLLSAVKHFRDNVSREVFDLVPILNRLIKNGQDWQRPPYFIRELFDFYLELLDNSRRGFKSEGASHQMIEEIELLYPYLDDLDSRRRALRRLR